MWKDKSGSSKPKSNMYKTVHCFSFLSDEFPLLQNKTKPIQAYLIVEDAGMPLFTRFR